MSVHTKVAQEGAMGCVLTSQEKRFQLQSIPAETVILIAINEEGEIHTECWFPPPYTHTYTHFHMLENWVVYIYSHYNLAISLFCSAVDR